MANLNSNTPATTSVDMDPIFPILGLAAYASDAFTAASAALSQARGAIGWETYKAADLEAQEAVAIAALAEAERAVLATKPESIQGCAALLAFVRRSLSDNPAMPESIRSTLVAIGNIQVTLGASIGATHGEH